MYRGSVYRALVDFTGTTLVTAVGWLPWRWALAVGGGFGRLAGVAFLRKRKLIFENLERAGATDPHRSYWQAARHTGWLVFETLWCIARPIEQSMAVVRTEGMDEIRQAIAEGKGVLLVSGHIGNPEFVPLAVAQDGHPVAVIARPLGAPKVESRAIDFRQRGGIHTLVRGLPGTSFIAYRWLRRGAVVGLMMDRVSSIRRVLVPFLGGATNMPLGPAELACRTGSAVVLGTARRLDDGKNLVTYRRLRTDGVTNPVEIARIVAEGLDQAIRPWPEQWYWIVRRQPRWEGETVVHSEDGKMDVEGLGADLKPVTDTASRPHRGESKPAPTSSPRST